MKKILLLLMVISNMASSQTILLKPYEPIQNQGAAEHLKHFDLLQFEVQSLVDQINAIQGNVKEITLRTPSHSWQLQLFEYSLLSSDYKSYTGGVEAIKILPKRTDFRTFKGYIKGENGSQVHLSVADGFCSILIDDKSERFFIEPLDVTSLSSDIPANQQFIMYKASDVKPHNGLACGADLLSQGIQDVKAQVQKNSTSSSIKPCRPCAIIKICLAADYRMFLKYGSTVAATTNQMLTIMGDVAALFVDGFANEYEYDVTGTFVAETAATDPWNASNTIAAMLTRFDQVGMVLFSQSFYNVATLWTSKFTSPFNDAHTVGTAYQGQACMLDRYSVCSDYLAGGGRQANYTQLQAHMLGHLWNMMHDINGSPCIMAPGSLNGGICWSFLSVDAMNAYVKDNKLVETGSLDMCPGSDAPIPDFSADITYGCQPVTVKFKNLSSNSIKWKWKFPGGIPDSSILKDPVIVYRTPGIYPVSLISSSSHCDVELVKTDYIEINDVPFADFGYGLQGREIFFIDQSLRATEWHWFFGDGEDSYEQMPSHEYPRDTIYEVTLIVKNDCGTSTLKKKFLVESVPIAEFTSDTIAGCAPQVIKFIDKSTNNVKTWQWDFYGGTPSTSAAKNPVVKYELPGTYDVRLTVYSTKYHHAVTKKTYITIDSIPIATFTDVVNVGQVDFTNQSRYAKAHLWIFGDNTTSTEANPTHNYTEGTYKVKYVVSNSCGTDTAETTLTIGVKPTAAFQSNTTKACVPFQIQFQNASIAANTYRWYFPGGNPSTSTDPNPLVSYNAEGKYNVSLVAANTFYSDSTGKTDFIVARTKPTGGFANTISGFKVTFTNNTTFADNYLWDFGDKKLSFLKDPPVHDYGSEGEFNVKLIASNECGQDTIIKHIAVYLVPKVNFTVISTKGCKPYRVQFFDKSSVDVIDWDWQFENGNPSTSKEQNPIVIFDKIGKYTVKLTVKNTNGSNARTVTQYIEVKSTVFCPEHTKTKVFPYSENPFGVNLQNRADESGQQYPIIYPNPAQDFIYVYTNASLNEPVQLEVFDLSGRRLSTHISKENQFRIQTDKLRGGTYYIKMNDGLNSSVNKFVISE